MNRFFTLRTYLDNVFCKDGRVQNATRESDSFPLPTVLVLAVLKNSHQFPSVVLDVCFIDVAICQSPLPEIYSLHLDHANPLSIL